MKITGSAIVLRDEVRAGDGDDLFRWCNLEEWNDYDEQTDHSRPSAAKHLMNGSIGPRDRFPGNLRWQIATLEGRHLGWVSTYLYEEQAQPHSTLVLIFQSLRSGDMAPARKR
jgi:hypothetical protein